MFFTLTVAFLVLFGCSASEKTSKFIRSVPQSMVYLRDTPKPAKEYFEKKIKEGEGGLHVFHDGDKTYLMLAEQNRMIGFIQEYTDHVRVSTFLNPSIGPSGGTYNGENQIPLVLYVMVINKIEKPYGVFRQEDLNLIKN
ncbi:hypothetical protein [Aneurinibacillus tyrosinisolvens]|uniref:hypothetical protein n=1 Tax=Aneurinibacillus tyrosinisolvens TaxID=1443435 RepID=UPI00063F673E|nr:hypothetical protein [Aneurinibacillus tyrosinisolvens]